MECKPSDSTFAFSEPIVYSHKEGTARYTQSLGAVGCQCHFNIIICEALVASRRYKQTVHHCSVTEYASDQTHCSAFCGPFHPHIMFGLHTSHRQGPLPHNGDLWGLIHRGSYGGLICTAQRKAADHMHPANSTAPKPSDST